VVYNRTPGKAEELAERFNRVGGAKVVAAPLENLCKSCCEILINCTPIGMHPNVDASPIDAFGEQKPALVFDTIYNPIETKLMREAKAAGIATVSGVEMFVRQAAGQFEGWTGRPAPVDVFRRVVIERLTQPAT
jgi:shikimate 5-dehydrogenase